MAEDGQNFHASGLRHQYKGLFVESFHLSQHRELGVLPPMTFVQSIQLEGQQPFRSLNLTTT